MKILFALSPGPAPRLNTLICLQALPPTHQCGSFVSQSQAPSSRHIPFFSAPSLLVVVVVVCTGLL